MDRAMLGEIELDNEEKRNTENEYYNFNNIEIELIIDLYLDTLEKHELIKIIREDFLS